MAAFVKGGWTILLAAALAAAPAFAAAPARERIELTAMVDGVREAIRAIPPAQRPPRYDALLQGALERLRVAGDRVPLTVIGRIPRPQMAIAGASPDSTLRADAREVQETWNLDGLADSAAAHLPEAEFRRISDAVEAYGDVDLDEAIRNTDEWLHAFDVKYGEGSARLNLVEVVLNGIAQRCGPFRPNDEGPSRYEIVMAYQTTWATVTDERASALSVFESGLRRYNFSWRPGGHDDWTGLVRPRYWTVGVLVAPGRDGALRWPLEGVADGETRAGPFLSWGDLKVAVLLGSEKRFVVSRQLQLLPGLF